MVLARHRITAVSIYSASARGENDALHTMEAARLHHANSRIDVIAGIALNIAHGGTRMGIGGEVDHTVRTLEKPDHAGRVRGSFWV